MARAFGDTALLVNAVDTAAANRIAAAMPAGNKREAVISRLEAGETNELRTFFW